VDILDGGKLVSLHREIPGLLRDLMLQFETSFCETDVSVVVHQQTDILADKIDRYRALLSRMKPYHFVHLQQDFDSSLCVPRLQSYNERQIKIHESMFINTDKMLQSAVLLLRSECVGNEKEILMRVVMCGGQLKTNFEELSKLLNSKMALEQQLPTYNSANQDCNELLISSCMNTSMRLADVCALMQNNLDFTVELLKHRGNQQHAMMHENAREYLKQVNAICMDEMDSPSDNTTEDQINELQRLLKKSEVEAEQLRCKLSGVEEEREKMKLERELEGMRFEKNTRNGSFNNDQLTTPTRIRTESNIPTDASSLGSLLSSQGHSDDREEAIKRHMWSRLSEWREKYEHEASQGRHHQLQCDNMKKHFVVNKKQIKDLREKISEGEKEQLRLKDKLLTTEKNYDGQLKAMSEHLAALNDKIRTQHDQIHDKSDVSTSSKLPGKKIRGLFK